MQITPLRVSKLQTKPIRLMLVSRSSRLKPRPLLKCVRTISPSSTSTLRPRAFRRCSITSESVLLPEPERPVNQIVKPVFVTYQISSCIHLQLGAKNGPLYWALYAAPTVRMLSPAYQREQEHPVVPESLVPYPSIVIRSARVRQNLPAYRDHA